MEHSPLRIAYQGEPGAFSEAAARRLAPEAVLVSCRYFPELFRAIRDGLADRILTPVENSIAGPVVPAREHMEAGHYLVCGEITLRIDQNLIGLPGACVEKLRTVQSHPVALAQCARFFAQYPHLISESADDTAGSVRAVMALGDPTRAAVAGAHAAALYGAVVLLPEIADRSDNFTRFLLLAEAQ
jgi:prephenate dehydratase